MVNHSKNECVGYLSKMAPQNFPKKRNKECAIIVFDFAMATNLQNFFKMLKNREHVFQNFVKKISWF